QCDGTCPFHRVGGLDYSKTNSVRGSAEDVRQGSSDSYCFSEWSQDFIYADPESNTKDETAQQAALLQGQVFLNAQPISIWLNDAVPPPVADDHPDDTSANAQPD